MARRNNKPVVPGAAQSLEQLKYEIANELGIGLEAGYNGDKTSRDMGAVGGNMVRRMIQVAEQSLAGRR